MRRPNPKLMKAIGDYYCSEGHLEPLIDCIRELMVEMAEQAQNVDNFFSAVRKIRDAGIEIKKGRQIQEYMADALLYESEEEST